MKKQIVRILLVIAVLAGLGVYAYAQGIRFGARAGIVGNLKFTYPGGTTPERLFNEGDFKPGDCKTASVKVENLSAGNSIVGVFSEGELYSDGLASALTIEIKDNGTTLYGPESLATFFADSDVLNQINLLTLAGNGTVDLTFIVCFPNTDDNELQGDSVVFDLKFGQIIPPIDLPDVCDELEGIVTEVIEGTPGDDEIDGTTASEFISGFGGNDEIDGGGGHDCIIGGPGEDELDGGSGNDIIDGGGGNDDIEGGSGNDKIYGRQGEDNIEGGSGNDYIEGNEDNDYLEGGSGVDTIHGGINDDRIYGGSGDDLIFGGADDDTIEGGSGDDEIYGQAGNDNIEGRSGNDYLHGGPGIDTLNGNSGMDTCVAGETLISC